MNAIELEDLTVTPHRRRTLLESVTLSVGRGECVELSGLSAAAGVGLLSVMGGVLAPDAGTVRLLGQTVYDYDDRTLAAFRNRHIGYVSREPSFWSRMNMLENVSIPLKLRGESAADGSAELLTSMGLSHALYAYPDSLSRYERIAAALARATVGEPDILLLDDVFSGLRAQEAEKLAGLIARLRRRRQLAAVHYSVSGVSPMTPDRTIYFRYGRVDR